MIAMFVFTVTKQPFSIEAGYDRLVRFLDVLKPFLVGKRWYFSPQTEEESSHPLISVDDRERFIARSQKRYADSLREWPEYPFGFYASLSSAADEKSFEIKKGLCDLTFAPGRGDIRLEIIDPDLAWPQRNTTELMKGLLSAVAASESVEFASLNVSGVPREDGTRSGDSYMSYMVDFRTFPHRQFLGWMGFVPKVLKPQDIPQAAEVIPMPDKHGSIVVAVRDTFDVHNPQHIKRAQQVEMRLVDLDALPVIDPSYL